MTCEQFPNEAANLSSAATPDVELLPGVRELVQTFRQRLGMLDPQQVAIWQQMAPAKKIRLAFQMYDMARRIIWTTERQAHPDASPQELGWRVLRRMHGKELCFNLHAQMS